MSESLNGIELVPLGGLSVVDLQRNDLAYLVSSSSDNHHQRSQEESRVLVPWDWSVLLTLVWGFDPVPSAVSVATETPSILQAALISGSSSEADHHAGGTSGLAESCRVVDSHLRSFTTAVELDPREWSLLHTQAPNVVNGFLASISSENKKMGFGENNGVAISSAWS